MHYLYSPVEKKEYLTALKNRLESPFQIFNERVTGVVIGPFFSVAHYQPYEWNRRITSECNRAYGFVKETHGELEISFVRSKGQFSPFWLLFYTLLLRILWAGMVPLGDPEIAVSGWIFSGIFALVVCGISAFHSSITEAGEAGAGEITKLLRNPKEYL